MLYKTKGVILRKVIHADNKMIVHVFTADYGYKSYMTYYSLRKDKKKLLSSIIPLAIVELCIEQKKSLSMEYIKEVELIHTSSPYKFDITKASISQFLNEVLLKVLCHSDNDNELYNFIEKALIMFDENHFSPDFHLRFLLHLTKFLGYCPENNYLKENGLLECEENQYQTVNVSESNDMDTWWHLLMQEEFFPNHNQQQATVPSHLRNPLLKTILSYYTEHIVNLSTLKSQEILHMVLRN